MDGSSQLTHSKKTKKQPEVLPPNAFLPPPLGRGRPPVRVTGVRTHVLGFPRFRGPARSFDPGRPHE